MDKRTGELIELGERVREWQGARGLSDTALLRRFPMLGTSRTYQRIREGRESTAKLAKLAELDLDRWINEYRTALNVMEAAGADEAATALYEDLSTVQRVRVALVGAMQQSGNSRLVLVQGASGSGKTEALRQMRERFGARIVPVEAHDLWKSNRSAVSAMLGDILQALGMAEPPTAHTAKLDKCVAMLSQTRVCLAIDEAHHMGPTALNLLKTLLNRTQGEFLLCAMGTLWRRLETQAYEEARQLTQNRLYERICFDSVTPADAAKVLGRQARLACDEKAATRAVCDAAANHGGLKFVARVAAACRELAGDDGGVDMETLARAIVGVQRRS